MCETHCDHLFLSLSRRAAYFPHAPGTLLGRHRPRNAGIFPLSDSGYKHSELGTDPENGSGSKRIDHKWQDLWINQIPRSKQ